MAENGDGVAVVAAALDQEKHKANDEGEDDVFVCYRPKKRRKKKTPPKIEIRLHSKSSVNVVPSTPPSLPKITLPHQYLDDIYTDPEKELEDTLDFFSETHEEQDPSYPAVIRQRALTEQKQQLQALADRSQTERSEIEVVVTNKYKEKEAATKTELDKHTQRLHNEKAHNLRRIEHIYQKRIMDIHTQIQNGVEMLTRKHQQQLLSLNVNNNSAEAEQHRAHMQAKHHRDITEFRARGDAMKQKVEAEFKKNQEKVRSHFQDRMDKEEHNKKGARQKLVQNFRLLQNRYLKQHAQRIAKERDAILEATADPTIDKSTQTEGGPASEAHQQNSATASSDQSQLLKPTDPMISCPSWHTANKTEATGGAARYKHRKGISSSLTRQLSIEMHNEGVWMSIASSSSTSDDKSHQHREFLSYGTTKVAEVLDAIVCGEIPLRCEGLIELHPQAAELAMAQGGQVRCVLLDFRTSEWTASQRRVMAMKDQEELAMKELDRKMTEFNRQGNEAENEVKRIGLRHKDELAAIQVAEETLNKVKMMQSEFVKKYQSMIGPDGKAIPELEPKKAMELNQRLDSFLKKINLCTQKVAALKRAHEDSKTKVQQYMAISKECQKKSAMAANMLKKRQAVASASSGSRNRSGRQSEAIETEKAATRIEDTVGALRRVADHRRSQVDNMKLPNASRQWIQSFPNIPGAMKKSIWHKLHRRKQYVILRPSSEAMINEIRMSVTQRVAQRHPGLTSTEKHAIAEAERLRAERLFLLATHPVAEEETSAFPPKRSLSEWGEPGWKLDLSVPGLHDYDEEGSSFLPRRKSFPVFEQNLAEMMSSPGRQAAAFLKLHTTRCLSSPLSAFGIASSPAEEATILPKSRLLVEGDAFNITDESLNLGYTFSMPPLRQTTAQSKKRSAASNKASADPIQDSSSSSKHSKASVGASTSSHQSRQTDGKKPSSPRRTSGTKKTGSGPSPKHQKTLLDPTASAMHMPQKPQLVVPPNQQQQSPPPQQQQTQQLQQMSQKQQLQQQQQQQSHHNHMAHRNQQLMQQQAQMNHQQQQQAAMHSLQRYPQAQQYSSQMAQLRMMQQQVNPNLNFPFYNPLGHSYPMAMQPGVRQPANPAAAAAAIQHSRHPSANALQQQHVQRQHQQQLVAGHQQMSVVQQQQPKQTQQQQGNQSQQANQQGSN